MIAVKSMISWILVSILVVMDIGLRLVNAVIVAAKKERSQSLL